VFVPDNVVNDDPSDTNVSLHPANDGETLLNDPQDPPPTDDGPLGIDAGPDVAPVPEPTNLILLGSGLLWMGRRLRARRAQQTTR
jgi:hypothetical protein